MPARARRPPSSSEFCTGEDVIVVLLPSSSSYSPIPPAAAANVRLTPSLFRAARNPKIGDKAKFLVQKKYWEWKDNLKNFLFSILDLHLHSTEKLLKNYILSDLSLT